MTPCSVLEEYCQRFGGTCCLRLQAQTTLKMEAGIYYLFMRLHSITSKKPVILIFTAVITTDLNTKRIRTHLGRCQDLGHADKWFRNYANSICQCQSIQDRCGKLQCMLRRTETAPSRSDRGRAWHSRPTNKCLHTGTESITFSARFACHLHTEASTHTHTTCNRWQRTDVAEVICNMPCATHYTTHSKGVVVLK